VKADAMASRRERAAVAAETVQILSLGSYTGPSGNTVALNPGLQDSVSGTRLFSPDQLAELAAAAPARRGRPRISVVNGTALSAARRLYEAHGAERVALLNFASARNPGGGFLWGSQAQEESLARASGLYAALSRMTEYYEANRHHRSAFYTDHMIHSPRVPVFRDDHDRLLDEPWFVSMITAPAVNAGAVRAKEPESRPQVRDVMGRRIGYVLALAAHHGRDALVLGAWGCGVFANEPREVAGLFAEHLLGEGRYAEAFSEVVFAVLDRKGHIIPPFAEVFGGSSVA
jgi:uncharacterized protein (TIGR02452 family)